MSACQRICAMLSSLLYVCLSLNIMKIILQITLEIIYSSSQRFIKIRSPTTVFCMYHASSLGEEAVSGTDQLVVINLESRNNIYWLILQFYEYRFTDISIFDILGKDEQIIQLSKNA
ncbi:hypothetical protein KSF78_0001654 [Schistosoma japonicum]|nr:hypothetical protein KSF78_0001654 [Schistosoma japonicum]